MNMHLAKTAPFLIHMAFVAVDPFIWFGLQLFLFFLAQRVFVQRAFSVFMMALGALSMKGV